MSEPIACLPVCSQSVSAAAMLARKDVKFQENIVCACVPSEGIGTANHPSGGTTTGPICHPEQRDWLEQLWHRLGQTKLTSPSSFNKALLLPVILLCIQLAITLLCYLYTSPFAVHLHPQFSFSSFFESGELFSSLVRPRLLSLQTDELV